MLVSGEPGIGKTHLADVFCARAAARNARIAWGMTATGADVQDLSLERVDVGKKRSMFHGEWVPIETVTADIPVRGHSLPLPFEVWKTRNGPIFAADDLDWEAPPSWLSRRSPRRGRRFRSAELRDVANAFEAINRASDWTSFTDAVGLLRPVDEHRLRGCRRQHRLRDAGRSAAQAGPCPLMAIRRRHGRDRSSWRAAAHVQPASGLIYSATTEIDRRSAAITRDWIVGFRASRLRASHQAQGVDLDAMAALQNDAQRGGGHGAGRRRRGD